MPDVGINCQPRKHRNLHYTCPEHHMRQPDGKGANVPEVEVCGGIQYTRLHADRRGGQDTVNPDGKLIGQRYINNDRQNAEQERG